MHPDAEAKHEALAQIFPDITIYLFLNRVSSFIERFIVPDNEMIQLRCFPLLKISLQHMKGQKVAYGRQENAYKQYLERELFHLLRCFYLFQNPARLFRPLEILIKLQGFFDELLSRICLVVLEIGQA